MGLTEKDFGSYLEELDTEVPLKNEVLNPFVLCAQAQWKSAPKRAPVGAGQFYSLQFSV